jgi:predicted RNase H-like HicB family nuclease
VARGIINDMKTVSKTQFAIEFDRETDGRWIAEMPRVPGVMAYGATKGEAQRRVQAIALRTLADAVDTGKRVPAVSHFFKHGVARC